MRKAKLIEDNSKLTHDAVSPFAHSVVNQTSSSSFLLKGPDLVKPLGLTLVAYDTDVTTVNYPTPAQTAFRDQLRTAVTLELNRLAKRLNLDYPGNEPALLSSGLTMGSMSGTAARSTANLGAPTEVELLDGATAGCLLLRLKRPLGAVQNLIRYSTDAALSEDQWHVVVGGGREREFGTFASGTRVYVKVACLTGSTTVPDYSAVLSRIVQ